MDHRRICNSCGMTVTAVHNPRTGQSDMECPKACQNGFRDAIVLTLTLSFGE